MPGTACDPTEAFVPGTLLRPGTYITIGDTTGGPPGSSGSVPPGAAFDATVRTTPPPSVHLM
jgi:hypothetical protein